ncbi:MAG: cytochrome P460 family protein [Cyanobacteria bacterium J06635_15]
MTSSKWISGLAIALISAAIAIALTHLTAFNALTGLYSAYDHPPTEETRSASDPNYGETTPTKDGPFVQFPADYQQQYFHYVMVDCSNSGIVRQMYVNRSALDTLKTSNTIPSGTVIVMETHSARRGSNGHLTPTRLNNVFIREKRDGWQVNADSGEWRSAWYSPSGSLVSNGQTSCIGCHTMVRERDYLFTLPALMAAAQTKQLQYQETEFGTSVCR